VFLWNEVVCRGVERLSVDDARDAINVLRSKLLLPVWKRKVMMDFAKWLHKNELRRTVDEIEKSKEAGRCA
jgi:hypothetical protein